MGLVDLQLHPASVDNARARSHIPGIHFLHILHGRGSAELFGGPTRAPDPQRYQSVHNRTTWPKAGQVAIVIDVQVADKYFVQVIVGDFLGSNTLVGASTYVKQELVAVTQLYHPAGRCLLGARSDQASTASYHTHFIGGDIFGAGIVDIYILQGEGGGRRSDYLSARFCANLDAAITRDGLATEAGISIRSLSRAFERKYGLGPMAFVRQRRLDACFAQLRGSDREATTVTEVAMLYGFWHMGKFAIAYRETFGESPSESLLK